MGCGTCDAGSAGGVRGPGGFAGELILGDEFEGVRIGGTERGLRSGAQGPEYLLNRRHDAKVLLQIEVLWAHVGGCGKRCVTKRA